MCCVQLNRFNRSLRYAEKLKPKNELPGGHKGQARAGQASPH